MILAIGHEAGTGKDTFSMFLYDWLRAHGPRNLNIVRQGFVTNLYEMCALFYGWAGFQRRDYYDQFPSEKDKVLPGVGKKVWEILEDVSDKLTEYDKNIFYDSVVKTTKGIHLKIIPDLRRPLEFDQLKRDGAYLLRVAKTGYTSNRKFCQYLLPYEHRWDKTILNDSTLLSLRDQANEFAKDVVLPRILKEMNNGI